MAASLLVTTLATATMNCWALASYRYDVPVDLLYSIAQQESSLNARAVAHANDGTRSVGLMQINSSWFPKLATYGVAEEDLYDPCLNLQVGAWILSQEIDRYGYSWEAIGAYYAGAYTDKNYHWKVKHYRWYANQVLDRWRELKGKPKNGVVENGQTLVDSDLDYEPHYVGGLGRGSAGDADS